MISAEVLAILVYCALAVTVITPAGLIYLLIRDYRRGTLW
jgi:hypothetical protein